MKKPSWLEKENLYNIIFEADTPAGKMFDIVLIIAISLSLIVSFIESVPTMARTFKTILEVLEYILTGYNTSADGTGTAYAVSDGVQGLAQTGETITLYAQWRKIENIIKKIMVYFMFVLILVTCLGTLMYMIENGQPGTEFTDIGTSVYWAIVTMTTVGYGDITPVTPLGRILSAFIMLLGYTIIAVPTGIVSATFIDETNKKVEKGLCPRCGGKVRSKDRFCSHCGEKL